MGQRLTLISFFSPSFSFLDLSYIVQCPESLPFKLIPVTSYNFDRSNRSGIPSRGSFDRLAILDCQEPSYPYTLIYIHLYTVNTTPSS